MNILLETNRLVLRQWEPSDETDLIRIAGQSHIEYWLYDWRNCAQWSFHWLNHIVKEGYQINDPFKHWMTWAIVLKDTPTLIGMINIGSDEYEGKEVGVGYFIDENFLNQGYATEAVKGLTDYTFGTYGYDYIVATVKPKNLASIKVIEKQGFRYVTTIEKTEDGCDTPVTFQYYRLPRAGNVVLDKIKKLFVDYTQHHNFSGVALIQRGSERILEYAAGYAHKGYQIPNNIHTRFDTASITKLFTAAGIVLLESEGKLHFADRIYDIIDLSGTEIPADVELRHLLTHTSGIADDADEESGEDYSALFVDSPNYAIRENRDFLKNFAYKKPYFKAGTAVRYNNCAFVLLGLAIEKVAGMGYREFIIERIFKPLGMEHTCFHSMDAIAPDIAEGYYYSEAEQIWKKNIYSYPPIGTGDSGAYTTVYDLDKFIRALMGNPIYQKMFMPQTEHKRLKGSDFIWYGYGFEFIERNGSITCLYKEGCNAGVCNITAYYPALNTTFTILGNQDCNVWRLHDAVQELLLEGKSMK